MEELELKINERVSRGPSDLFLGGPHRFGRVIEIYKSKLNGLGQGHVFYAVQWDSGEVTRGHLRAGLKAELNA